MRHMKPLLLLAAAVWAAAPIDAQVTVTPSPRARAYSFSYSESDNHARIGVVVNIAADAQNDRLGARLEAVTPGGPADKAGLKAGDVITKFNGTALGGAKADDEDESGPGHRLIELAHALDPGDTVRVEYRRGNETKTATLVAERSVDVRVRVPPMAFNFEPEMRWRFNSMLLGGMHGAWGGLELVALEPELGEYFGVREGLLVLKATGDTTLPLKAGDVILSFDGRKPTSPSHAMRILGSYEAGEQVILEVQRKQKRQNVTWTVPEREEQQFRGAPRRTPQPARQPRPGSGRTEES